MSSSLSIDILIKSTEHALSATRGWGEKEAKYQLFQKKKTTASFKLSFTETENGSQAQGYDYW